MTVDVHPCAQIPDHSPQGLRALHRSAPGDDANLQTQHHEAQQKNQGSTKPERGDDRCRADQGVPFGRLQR